jgi:predicted ATPase
VLKRLYVDNFKCLVNFELSVGPINLLMGPNGAGKSTVFEILRKLQAFVGGDGKVEALFRADDCTRWQKSPIQTFELEIEGNGGVYRYELAVEHNQAKQLLRVQHERLWFNSRPLLGFEEGDVQLYRDDHSIGPKYPFDWSLSAVASMYSRPENTRLTWFKQCLARFIIVQIIPSMMVEDSVQEETRLCAKMENYVSWYRYLSQDQGKIFELTNELREVLDGFAAFKFDGAGDQRRLKAIFSASSSVFEYRFSELSDGQRMLIALYTLICCTQGGDRYTLCIDEPENFLALPEIKPWLVKLYDLCADGQLQALLVSHHPELINYLLASPVGLWLDRENNGPVRARPIASDDQTGLSVSELIARGWLYEQA